MENGPERFARFRRMAEIVHEEVPIVLRYNGLAFYIFQTRLRNVVGNMMIDAPYKYLDLRLPGEG